MRFDSNVTNDQTRPNLDSVRGNVNVIDDVRATSLDAVRSTPEQDY
jgi:hypothetical protein